MTGASSWHHWHGAGAQSRLLLLPGLGGQAGGKLHTPIPIDALQDKYSYMLDVGAQFEKKLTPHGCCRPCPVPPGCPAAASPARAEQMEARDRHNTWRMFGIAVTYMYGGPGCVLCRPGVVRLCEPLLAALGGRPADTARVALHSVYFMDASGVVVG